MLLQQIFEALLLSLDIEFSSYQVQPLGSYGLDDG